MWCGQAVVWPPGQSRQLPSGDLFKGYKSPGRATAWWICGFFCPKAWSKDQARLDKAGVPKAYRAYRTRHQLALELLAVQKRCLAAT